MSTYVATIRNIRRILNDRPLRDEITGAIGDTTTETFTPTDVTKYRVGQVLEHDDGGETGAEQRIVTAVDAATPQVTADRGYNGSTAATHAANSFVLMEPRFTYDKVKQAIDQVLDSELFNEGIFDIVEHQITSSATTYTYNAPSTNCLEFLRVYQKTSAMSDPKPLLNFTREGINVDTSLYSNGKYFRIIGNFGVSGTDVYYVNCKHKLAIGTLTASQERIVHMLSCAYLLEWEEPRRLAGPTNQGDRTVRTGDHARNAAYYRGQAEQLMAKERATIRALNPAYTVWKF